MTVDIKSSTYNLSIGFFRSCREFSNRPALDFKDNVYTYCQLGSMAGVLQNKMSHIKEGQRLIALLAYRSPTAYAGVLGILGSGRGYVPLHPEFPTVRNLNVLNLSGTDVLIVGHECQGAFTELLKLIDRKMTFILVSLEDANKYTQEYPQHNFINVENLTSQEHGSFQVEPVSQDDIAYLLFTSGSTGEPKGVPVSHHNARSYVEFVKKRYDINEHDRVSQMHDMTFDNSVHDIFVAWEIGACLCVPTKEDRFLPVSFIQKQKLTLWFSVPSVGVMIDKYGRLEPDVFPTLRYSFFAGEALYMTIAEKWQKAARNSKIINTYGPTETTVTVSYYDWDSQTSPAQCINGIVPLGQLYEGHVGRVVLDDGQKVARGEAGELCLSGPQVTKEYWNNPMQTKAHYVQFSDTGDMLWYKSGDLVREGIDGCLYYLGRIDNQVKIQGNRVELGAIDKVLREASGVDLAVSMPLLISPGNASAVVAFICSVKALDEQGVLEFCRSKLPKYMVPSAVHFIDDMPLNRNGKVDRLQLKELLEKGK